MMTPEKETNDSRAKRQRTSPPMQATVVHLSADLWCDISDFLPKTSRALMAVALTAPPASFRESGWKGQPNAVSKAIISAAKDGVFCDTLLDELCEEERVEVEIKRKRHGSKMGGITSHINGTFFTSFRNDLAKQIKQYYDSAWEVMDFVDISVSLASRLSDDDVGAVLVCIDAKNDLKRLKLTNCFNVVGIGLDLLRQSVVLEYLDLELVRQFEEPWLHVGVSEERQFDEIKLCEGFIFDILEDILREEGNSFRRFQYPYKWYNNAAETDAKKRLYEGKQIMRAERFDQFVNDHNVFLNKYTCCMHFGCDDEMVELRNTLEEGNNPEDNANMCIDCAFAQYSFCTHCNQIMCDDCCLTEECSVCDARYCPSCSKDYGLAEVVHFYDVNGCEPYCSSCRLNRCKNGSKCEGCRKLIFDALLEENNAKQALIDAQVVEIERLRRNNNNS